MAVPFEYYVGADDASDASGHMYTGTVRPIRIEEEPFEAVLTTRGCSFHLIFGKQINGNFLCIPDWQFGCELARLSDILWNVDSILRASDRLGYEEAYAISHVLKMFSRFEFL